MKKLLLIALLIVGCSIEPLNDIMGVVNPEYYTCSVYGYANIYDNINQISNYEDSLSVLTEINFRGDKVNDAKNACNTTYNDGYVYYYYNSTDSIIGIFDSCNCVE